MFMLTHPCQSKPRRMCSRNISCSFKKAFARRSRSKYWNYGWVSSEVMVKYVLAKHEHLKADFFCFKADLKRFFNLQWNLFWFLTSLFPPFPQWNQSYKETCITMEGFTAYHHAKWLFCDGNSSSGANDEDFVNWYIFCINYFGTQNSFNYFDIKINKIYNPDSFLQPFRHDDQKPMT